MMGSPSWAGSPGGRWQGRAVPRRRQPARRAPKDPAPSSAPGAAPPPAAAAPACSGPRGAQSPRGAPRCPRAHSPRRGRSCRAARAAAAAPHLPGARPPPSGRPLSPPRARRPAGTGGGRGVGAPLAPLPAATAAAEQGVCPAGSAVRSARLRRALRLAAGAGARRGEERGRRLVSGAGSAPRAPAPRGPRLRPAGMARGSEGAQSRWTTFHPAWCPSGETLAAPPLPRPRHCVEGVRVRRALSQEGEALPTQLWSWAPGIGLAGDDSGACSPYGGARATPGCFWFGEAEG